MGIDTVVDRLDSEMTNDHHCLWCVYNEVPIS